MVSVVDTFGDMYLFGFLQELRRRVDSRRTGNIFDTVFIYSLSKHHPRYLSLRDEARHLLPIVSLRASVETDVSLTGYLLPGSNDEEANQLADILADGLDRIMRKSPSDHSPSFSKNARLLMGAADGIANIIRRKISGRPWSDYRDFILAAASRLADSQSDTCTVVLCRATEMILIGTPKRIAFHSSSRSEQHCIAAAWAHYYGLQVDLCLDDLTADLQSLIFNANLDILSPAETYMLLVVLNEAAANSLTAHSRVSLDTLKILLRGFLPCSRRDLLAGQINNEKDVQRIIWTILRTTFQDLVDEESLPRFGVKNYQPDFAIPTLRVLIEVKYVGDAKTLGDLQDELLADVVGYLQAARQSYDRVVLFIYDTTGRVAADTNLSKDLMRDKHVEDVIVVIGPRRSSSPKQARGRV